MRILVGSDPELFLVNRDGMFRSAFGLIPGTKKDPYPVEKGTIQVDGMAAEIGITATDNEDEWVENHTRVMEQLRGMLPKGYNFSIVPSCRFHGSHFKKQPEEAKELGCDPDFNAYTLEVNPRPDNNTTMRTASGHVHVGFCENADITSPEHIQRCATLVKQLDCYLGLPSLMWDRDTKRRSMYGRAGAFRPKPYGVEYRVLSNAWLENEKRMRFVFKATNIAVKALLKGERPFTNIGEQYVQSFINNSNVALAEHFVSNQVVGISLKEVRECL